MEAQIYPSNILTTYVLPFDGDIVYLKVIGSCNLLKITVGGYEVYKISRPPANFSVPVSLCLLRISPHEVTVQIESTSEVQLMTKYVLIDDDEIRKRLFCDKNKLNPDQRIYPDYFFY